LAAGFLGTAPTAEASPIGPTLSHPGDSIGDKLVEIKNRGNGVSIDLPAGPSSRYYDYSYYYSRGYYPTHIGGYVYYNPKTYNPDHEAAGYEEGAPYSAAERCDRRFRSFEWDTGLYTTYGGNKKLCPYLR
jgi:hypothetical protein